MPVRAPVVIAPSRYSLRHIGPNATIAGGDALTTHSVLARSDMVARPLPASALPSSPDLVSGTWTARLGDAGEITAVFPNAVASDGQPWRSRFDPTGHLQWLEVSNNGEIEAVGVIDTAGPDQQQVQLHAYDGFWLLKKAYDRDWICTEAPATVMRRACSLWVPLVADDFNAPGGLSSSWTINLSNSTPTGSISQQVGGGMLLSLPADETPTFGYVTATGPAVPVPGASPVWRTMVTVPSSTLAAAAGAAVPRLRVTVTESNGDVYGLTLSSKAGQGMAGTLLSSLLTFQSTFGPGNLGEVHATIQNAGSYTLQLESDGLWVWGFVNGQLISCVRRTLSSVPTTLQTQLALIAYGGYSNIAFSATVGQVTTEAMVPFLQSESDPGDYMLPGDETTFPWGGLHGRYFNDLDLANDADRLEKILNPTRTQAYGSSAAAEYANEVDATLNGTSANPTPGAQTTNWSAVWIGAIWLQMSAGNYSFQLVDQTGNGVRVWVGDTSPDAVLLDQWAFGEGGTHTFTVTQAHLTGTLPNGQGTVIRDGWYPIRIEFRVDSNSAPIPSLSFTSIPTGYTDPGGTILTAGAQTTIVPATSLSPLGCVDNRYQGVSHYDLIQQTSQAFGYQFTVEPKQLEAKDPTSGASLFPGVCAPRLQEGTLTDVILAPDDSPSQDGESILNYSTQLQTQDFSSSMWGNGAGQQSGNGAQMQGVIFDAPTMLASLFDAQAWTDFSDAAFPELLQASLSAAQSLRSAPWQVVAADPMGRPRLAYTWPLPGDVLAFRWRPGYGLMLRAPQINLWDVLPRQMLAVQRSFMSEGITGSTATFAQRPKGVAYQIAQEIYKVRRWQRNYQHQLVTLTGATSDAGSLAAGATDTGASHITLLPGDRLVALTARVTFNSADQAFGFVINGTDITTSLPSGPWNNAPVNIDLTPIWSQVSSNLGAKVQIINKGSSASVFNYQALADVIR